MFLQTVGVDGDDTADGGLAVGGQARSVQQVLAVREVTPSITRREMSQCHTTLGSYYGHSAFNWGPMASLQIQAPGQTAQRPVILY